MKKILFLMLLCFNSLFVIGQTVWNTNAGAARFICESDASFTQEFDAQPTCISSTVKLYYYLKSDTTLALTHLFDISVNNDTVESAVKVWRFDSKSEIGNYLEESPILNLPDDYSQSVDHELTKGKFYLLELSVRSCSADVEFVSENGIFFDNSWREEECAGCLSGFLPDAGTYILSAWVLDSEAPLGTVDYNKPLIRVTSGGSTVDCYPKGEIIDGWQRIEEEVIVEEGEEPTIELICEEGGECFFDDIRFFPKDASMVTYVYDQKTLRLMAELDERNYAKIYEYDEQGKLVRVKKETEMGIMTIQENRENNSKE